MRIGSGLLRGRLGVVWPSSFASPTPFSHARLASLLSARYFGSAPDSMVKIFMPALSPTMKQGNLVSWRFDAGKKVSQGDVIAEIETDKATLEFESPEEGYIARYFVENGTNDIAVGQLIATIVEDEKDIAAAKDYTPDAKELGHAAAASDSVGLSPAPSPSSASSPPPPSISSTPTPTPTPTPTSAPAPAQTSPPSSASGILRASPYARTVATQRNVPLNSVSGSGFGGRIIAADVLEFSPPAASVVPSATMQAQPGAGYVDIPLTNMRRVIADRLVQSKQEIPHYYLTVECVLDELLAVRERFNASSKDAFKLSVNDFIVKASALACRKVPAVNSSWMGTEIREYDYVDVCVAVSTNSGLITPIIADADRKGLSIISNEIKDLANRARENKLLPHEYQGGTFTISNLGMFGIKKFTAIINPPQACILAVGASEKVVVPNPQASAGESPYKTVSKMSVTLSCDHRVVDGAVGSQWLQEFKKNIEQPINMLL